MNTKKINNLVKSVCVSRIGVEWQGFFKLVEWSIGLPLWWSMKYLHNYWVVVVPRRWITPKQHFWTEMTKLIPIIPILILPHLSSSLNLFFPRTEKPCICKYVRSATIFCFSHSTALLHKHCSLTSPKPPCPYCTCHCWHYVMPKLSFLTSFPFCSCFLFYADHLPCP